MSFGFKMLQKFIQVTGTVRVRVNLNIVCDYLYKQFIFNLSQYISKAIISTDISCLQIKYQYNYTSYISMQILAVCIDISN